jgi:hypothetical protein
MLLDLEAAAVAKEVTDFIKELTSSVTDEGE